ncbi:MAG: TolC family protein [Ignavibacterium sp.]|jgi:outer membrane protein TolC|uniref:TolC family protein n=1 Tax=Ignavibacterium sp. TaxID=2651167 RepID=UPI003299D8D7
MKNKLIFNLLGLILFISPSFSQNRILNLDDAINIALENNRDIKLAKMTVEKAGAAVDEAFGYALPSLDLNGTFTHFLRKPKMPFPDFEALLKNATYSILFDENVIPRDNNKFVPVETQLQSFAQSNNYEAQLLLTQTLFSSTVFRGIGASRIYYNLSKAELNNTISKTVLSVQTTFYGVLLAKQLYEITNASFLNAQDNLRNVKALFDQGLVSEFDMLQAEVQVENIRPLVLQMENTLKSAKDGLKVLLGIPQEEPIDITGEIVYTPEELPDEFDLISEALQSNFGLKSLDLKKQVDEAFIQIDVSEYWPNIAAFGSYSYAGSSDKWNFQNYSSLTVGLSFSINLWKGNRTKNRVEQSTITFKQTEEQMNLYKDFLVTQVRAKYSELKRVQTLVDAQNKNVKVAERAYEIAKVRYKEGTGSQLEIQNADIALKQARTNYIQSVHSYLVTKFEMDQLLGRTNQEYLLKYETE